MGGVVNTMFNGQMFGGPIDPNNVPQSIMFNAAKQTVDAGQPQQGQAAPAETSYKGTAAPMLDRRNFASMMLGATGGQDTSARKLLLGQ